MIVAMVGVIAMAGVANADIASNLVTHYEFNDNTTEADLGYNSVTTVNDTLDGTGTLTQVAGPGGSITNAGNFGTGAQTKNIFVGGGPYVGTTGSVTISTWFTMTGVLFTDIVCGHNGFGTGNVDMMFLEFPGSGQLQGWAFDNYTGGPSLNVQDPGTTNDGAWHHAAWVWTGGAPDTSKLYIDGVLVAQGSNTLGDMATNEWSVGARNTGAGGGNYGLDGSMADVRIYDRALSDGGVGLTETAGGDIAELYALKSAAPVPEPAGLGLIGLALLAVRKRRS